MHNLLKEIAPLVTGIKPDIYTLPTERNYSVSYLRKILHVNTAD